MPTTAALATIAGTAVSAGTAISAAADKKKAAKQQADAQKKLQAQAGANPGGIFGEPVQFDAPEYKPMEEEDPGYADFVKRILAGDLNNLGDASSLSGGINKEISKATRARIEGWDPSFMGALSTLQKTRNQTLKGHLPYEDALAITADRGRLANDMGQAGGAAPQVAADLGMKRLDLMTNTGPNLTASIVNILNGVDPVARHTTPTDYLLNPQQTLPLAIQDRQFGATFNFDSSLTQAYLDAAPNPGAQGQFSLQAFQAGLGNPGQGSGTAMMGAVGNAFSALGQINWAALMGKGSQPAPSVQAAQQNPYIGSAGYVPSNANNPGGAGAVNWAMGA